jgi:hypothetical protein
LRQPQRSFEVVQIEGLKGRVAVAGGEADEGGGNTLLDQGVAVAAEEFPDVVLDRDAGCGG